MIFILQMYKGIVSKEEALEKIDRIRGYGRYSEGVYEYFRNEVR